MRKYLLPSFLVLLDILIFLAGIYLAVVIRLAGLDEPFNRYSTTVFVNMPIFLAFFLVYNVFFRLYNREWRFVDLKEIIIIIGANFLSAITAWGFMAYTGQTLPRTIYILGFFLVAAGVAGSRLALRFYLSNFYEKLDKPAQSQEKKRVMIIGAGSAGSILLRGIEHNHKVPREVLAFVDDDPAKKGVYLNNVKIYGGRECIPQLVKELKLDEIFIALPSITPRDLRTVLQTCNNTNCKTFVMPSYFCGLEATRIDPSAMRPLRVEDLLARDPVDVDLRKFGAYLQGQKVLVTGAGGSIGSELCRQIIQAEPSQLILLGRGENSIYEIYHELIECFPPARIYPVIMNVANKDGLREVFQAYKPDVVFHAAAHKHVPLMEGQPEEAVLNNVFGTWGLAELAGEYGVKHFVMISTDKAVNPTSVMGATKRTAEKICQALNKKYSQTIYVAVRFGNVLGSRGSVVPLFRKQIAAGGPVTITDPRITRYFMTIPEASKLVIQAGSIGQGGEVFVLDMGEPVRIQDLAEHMIHLAGYEPNVDIEIKYTGLRPGEKLYEELFLDGEGLRPSPYPKISCAILHDEDPEALLELLQQFSGCKTEEEYIAQLQKIVHNYHPNHFDAEEVRA